MLALAATDSEGDPRTQVEEGMDHRRRSSGATPESQHVEEGIAHAYVRWLQGERMDGMINRAFKNFKTFLKGLYQALTAHDIRTADDVFRQIKSGKIGGRTQVGAGIEVTTPGQTSPSEPAWMEGQPFFSQPVPSEVVDLFDGPAEQLVIPGPRRSARKRWHSAGQKRRCGRPWARKASASYRCLATREEPTGAVPEAAQSRR